MLRIPAAVWLVVLSVGVSRGTQGAAPAAGELRTGDLVFQASRSAQSAPIQRATHSRWSHVGLVEVAPDGVFVLEAVSPVSRTPWARWVARGERGEALALRPRGLAPAAAARVIAEARRHLGKPYDAAFGWGDDRLYCSELARKAFERGAGIDLGKLERLGDLDVAGLEAPMRARFGRVPAELLLVTPASLAADPRLAPLPRSP